MLRLKNNAILAGILFAQATTFANPNIQFKDIRISGTGCSKDDTGIIFSQDKKAMTLTFSQFSTEVNSPTTTQISQVDCKIALILEPSQGYTFAVASVDYRGFVSLDPGSKAVLRTKYRMQKGEKEIVKSVFQGPDDKDFQRFDSIVPSRDREWLPCRGSKKLVIKNTLRVKAKPHSSGFIALDSIDSEIGGTMRYNLTWKKCSTRRNRN